MIRPPFSRPTLAQVSLSSLRHNFALAARASGRPVMAMVKADAYGHGAVQAARAFVQEGARSFGVATLEEGAALRAAGLKGDVVVLGALDPAWLPEAARLGLGVTAWSRGYLGQAARLLKKCPSLKLQVHLKVDTGMARLGFDPAEIPGVLADLSARWPFLKLASAYTHLACADGDPDKATESQIKKFRAVAWPKGLRLHAANSAALLRYPGSRLDMVRPGILLYGALEPTVHPLAKRQKPALSFVTGVIAVRRLKKGQGVSYGHTFRAKRDTWIATLAAGYADGVPRLLSNRAEVLLGGRRCRVAGRVCMDLCMVDTGQVRPIPGQEAVLIGRQGREEVTAREWAKLAGTNAYEILCGISSRVPRVYL